MKVLNICMNAPFTEKYSYQDNLLTEYQQKIGHEVTIITSTRTRDVQGKICDIDPCDKILDNGVRLIRIQSGNKIQMFWGWYPKIKELIEEVQPQMIFVHGLCSFVTSQALRYKKKANYKVKVVADNHQDEGTTKTKGFPFSLQFKVFRSLWKKWIKNVEKVYGTTSWRTEFAHIFYGIPENKLDTLIMGVDVDSLPENRQLVKADVRKELGIDESKFIFISGGKLDKNKSIIEAAKAFQKIKNSDVVFVIFGSVAEDIKEEFEKLLMIEPRIIYLGYLSSKVVHRYFIAADFGVFPGRHSVLWEEAVGCELPCAFRKYGESDHTNVCGNCLFLKKLLTV